MSTLATKNHVRVPLAERLHALAYNLWWTWNPEAHEIFRNLSYLAWRNSNHNAVAVLREVSRQELNARLLDEDFSKQVKQVLEEFDTYMEYSETWAQEHVPNLKDPIAYFAAEFGIHECLPIYSGGLGVLSGDHIKAASDLGIPFCGVGLFYRNGYFQQRVGPDGWQQELYPANIPENLPMKLVRQSDGKPLLNSVEIGHSNVYFQTWAVQIGRVTLYLLDTNLTENDQHYQNLTSNVYGGDIDTRIGHEILLGIGGVRLLDSLGIHPSMYHMNEGHSAFLTLELFCRELKSGKNKEDAAASVKKKCVFTTHTPVPAGHDRFSSELMLHALGRYWNATGLSHEDLMTYGRVNPADQGEQFTMTVLALKMSHAANGVSKLHGSVSREMWKSLFKTANVDDVPIGYVTNGVHTPGWATKHAHEFWNKRLGFDWTRRLVEPKFWKKIQSDELASDEELWALRYSLRRDLVDFARRQLRDQNIRLGGDGSTVWMQMLSPDALTIGFARRFATYKRAPLIFRHLEKIIPLLTDQKRPVQIIFAGKAHPRDGEGKRYLQRIIEITRLPQLFGKVIFIENYDINVARELVAGSDVWLNTPRRPLEASGTSGMKVAIHGGLNVSVLDGWWPEAYNGTNGWSIGNNESISDMDQQDEQDFEHLYRTLAEEVIPEFYDRDEQGIPRKWIQRIRNSMETLIPVFNTTRMVAEYVKKYYVMNHAPESNA
jgi:starch phosphorylase